MSDKTKGLYNKFTVYRNDGSSAIGGKHHGCEYFVLDLTHDQHAKAAILAYADSCQKEYPALAADLRAKVNVSSPRHSCLQYVLKHCDNVKQAAGLPRQQFDDLVKDKKFIDGPFREGFGDGAGEPYNPKRQAFGKIKQGNSEIIVWCELSQ